MTISKNLKYIKLFERHLDDDDFKPVLGSYLKDIAQRSKWFRVVDNHPFYITINTDDPDSITIFYNYLITESEDHSSSIDVDFELSSGVLYFSTTWDSPNGDFDNKQLGTSTIEDFNRYDELDVEALANRIYEVIENTIKEEYLQHFGDEFEFPMTLDIKDPLELTYRFIIYLLSRNYRLDRFVGSHFKLTKEETLKILRYIKNPEDRKTFITGISKVYNYDLGRFTEFSDLHQEKDKLNIW